MAGSGLWDDPGILWDDPVFLWDSPPVVSTGPVWAPTGVDVADYVPHRTLTTSQASTTESQDSYQYGWSDTTRPTDDTVTRLINRAVGVISARVTPMAVASYEAGKTICCMLAAAAVERGWPEDEFALQRANDLEKQAYVLLDALVASNEIANGGDGDPDTGFDVSPVWSFPEADSRWDYAGYF